MANGVLGSASSRVELVAVDANPQYIGPDYLAAFDQQEGLNRVTNWASGLTSSNNVAEL